MQATRRAIIDVGTNSIKLLVADVSDAGVAPVLEESEQTRLGAGFFETKRLQPEPVAHTARAVGTFVGKARELGAVSIRIIATSAARDAVNPDDLTSAIESAAGLKVDIISGDEEADLAFQGVTTDAELARQPLLLVDVGGGSTEFILGQGREKEFRRSFQLGTVRLLEKSPPGDPPTPQQLAACRDFVKEFFDREVRPVLGALNSRLIQLVGTGGTATILARMEARLDTYDRQVIESTRINAAQIHARVGRLWAMPLTERKLIVGLPKNRADVILPGLVIYEQLMACFNFAELRITTRGLRFGAVMAFTH